MANLNWPPAVIRDLTIAELVCLSSERPPGRGRIENAAEFAHFARQREAEERAWAGGN